jgi:glutaredoxin 2
MATKKTDKALLKDAEAKIAELMKTIASKDDTIRGYRERAEKAELEVDSVHAALDAMLVPRMVKSGYREQNMTIASRLFAWGAGAKIENSVREIS